MVVPGSTDNAGGLCGLKVYVDVCLLRRIISFLQLFVEGTQYGSHILIQFERVDIPGVETAPLKVTKSFITAVKTAPLKIMKSIITAVETAPLKIMKSIITAVKTAPL